MTFLEYEDIANSSEWMRATERDALEKSVELLKRVLEPSAGLAAAAEASFFAKKLWTAFIIDLGGESNNLPSDLRAKLISISIRMIKCSDRILMLEEKSIAEMIEVSEIIKQGIGE